MDNNLFLFFLQIGILLITSLFLGEIAKKIKVPPIVGELFAGIILGPSILKNLSPDLYYCIINGKEGISSELNYFTQLAMLFFMFYFGLEVDIKHSMKGKRIIIITSLFSLIIPLLLGIGVVNIFRDILIGEHTSEYTPCLSLFMGVAISISALPIILKILDDLNIIKTDVGSIIVSSAIFNDLIGWALFAGMIPLFTQKRHSFLEVSLNILVIIIFPISLILVTRFFRQIINKLKLRKRSVNIGFYISYIIIIAAVAEKCNVHPFFAVFIMGVTLKHNFYNTQVKTLKRGLNTVCSAIISPLYFATIGLKTDFISDFDIRLVIIITFVACFGKILGAGLGAFLGGMDWNKSLCIGLGMNARGAMEIIMASAALQMNIISKKIYVSLVIMAIMTSIISSLGMKLLFKLNYKGLYIYDLNES